MTIENTEFFGFPKMARLSREMRITEKIDGTNSQLLITKDNRILVGSRTRWITPSDDNHGFAKWVRENKEELLMLGPGRHFGEWWGNGINSGYGLKKGDNRFSLFNTIRWVLHGETPQIISNPNPNIIEYQDVLPKCCGLVPELYRGMFDTNKINEILEQLKEHGSYTAPGFMHPEGIIIFHVAGNVGFKKTIEKDEIPKSLVKTKINKNDRH